jgi:hypothetical protein
MKRIFTLCLVVLTAITTVKAQHEIGGIVGGLNGVSYKYWFNKSMALQADLAVGLTQGATSGGSMGLWDFTVNPNFLYHFDVAKNLKVYTGGGLNLGMVSVLSIGGYGYGGYGYGGYGYYAPKLRASYGYGYSSGSSVAGKFGIDAVAGIAYEIPSAPVVLAFDSRPGYGLMFTSGASVSYFDWKLAFAVRYRL